MSGVRDPVPALFSALPHLSETVPWMALGAFPTPVERVIGLISPSVELWVKRDDQSGGARESGPGGGGEEVAALYGGNKVRKLEFLLAEARASGARRLATVGGIGSHHVLATALYGARAGFEVEAVVFPQPVTDHVREQILADVAAGARLTPTRGLLGVPSAVRRARRASGTAWIAPGGSSVAGTLGYVSAGLELRAQVARGELPAPDVVYAALGSCGTVAGLLVGLGGAGAPDGRLPTGGGPEVVGVRVVDRVVCNARKTLALARATRFRILPPDGKRPISELARLRVEHRFFGGAYGRSTPEADEAVRRASEVGLLLEPTYTGKALAALLADAQAGRLDGKRVLFLHSYSGVDLSPLLARAPAAATLPPLLRRHFVGGGGGMAH
jgi:D-cysteine desulfhydrase